MVYGKRNSKQTNEQTHVWTKKKIKKKLRRANRLLAMIFTSLSLHNIVELRVGVEAFSFSHFMFGCNRDKKLAASFWNGVCLLYSVQLPTTIITTTQTTCKNFHTNQFMWSQEHFTYTPNGRLVTRREFNRETCYRVYSCMKYTRWNFAALSKSKKNLWFHSFSRSFECFFFSYHHIH